VTHLLLASTASLLVGCATSYHPCSTPQGESWQRLKSAPRNAEVIVHGTETQVVATLSRATHVEWFSSPDGSYLACVPAKAERDTCAADFRANSCGQLTLRFQRDGSAWAPANPEVIACTCDPPSLPNNRWRGP
jgi:hypothetical protein